MVADLADQLGASPVRAAQARRVALDIDGNLLSGLRWGAPGAAVDQVFLHSGGQNAHAWDRLLLGGTNTALAFDLPGHGHSSWLEPPTYLPRQMAPIVGAGIGELAPHMSVLVGASLGGLIALHFSAQNPEAVSRLVLVDVTPGSTPERAAGALDFMEVESFDSFEAMLAHTVTYRPGVTQRSLRRSLLHQTAQGSDGRWRWRLDRRDPAAGPRMKIVFADIASYWDDVAALRCPTLLVVGGDSPIITPPDIERFTSLAPQSRVTTVPGVGHAIHSQAPNELRRVIDDFVDLPIPH